jgi:multidrug efflux pump
MRLSDLSIGRPVLATVMSLLVVLAGVAAYTGLPVREYADVDNPVVSITTAYVGASPETVEATITEPIEQSLNGVEGIRAISSVSGLGASAVDVEFVAGRDIDLAANDVSNAIQRALRDLPSDAERPVVSKSDANSRPIMWLSVFGERYSDVDLTDIADRVVKTPLQILPGVARIIVGGQREYAMRVWLDPVRMAERRVDAADVRRTVRESNLQLPAGEIEGRAQKFVVLADAQIDDPEVYEDLVIRHEGGVPVRIRDVGRVELGSANYQTVTRNTGKPIIGVGVVRHSRANELELSQAVRAALPAIRAALPEGVDLEIAVDTTIFVEASLREVWITLAIAFAAVVVVNLVFLRSLATTIIASIAIPVSVVGTFAIMWALGFSINVLTLLALVLAIGLLVDDAIVVMENVYRRRELGEGRTTAARRGAREVGFAVLATTVAIVAVLVPISLLTGNIGRLFREFALTMAGSLCISTFVALTLVPMLCSRHLDIGRTHGAAYNAVERGLGALRAGYARALAWALRRRAAVGGLLALNVVAGIALFTVLPQTLVPIEDRGQFLTMIRAPQGSTLAYTKDVLLQVEERLARIPEVTGFFAAVGLSFGGPRSTSDGFVFTRLQHWRARDRKQQSIVAELVGDFAALPGALVFPINLPSFARRGATDLEFILKNASASLEELGQVTGRMLGRMRELPSLVNVDSTLRLDNPQVEIAFERERAAELGVSIAAIAESLQILLAESEVSEFVLRNKQYDVIAALAARHRSAPEQIADIHVRARDGAMVPLASLVRVVPTVAPATLNHYDLQRSVTLTASLAPGAALGDALAAVQAIAAEELPPGFTTALGGDAREFAESSVEIYLAFGLALAFIYLVLSAQFESFVHPLTILVSVPLALFGALLTLAATGNSLNLYSQIGVILLVGLVTKNSILLVDYANQARARGLALVEAIGEAGRNRFRPILMTSVTSIFGTLPLMLATGAGAESRQPIGAAVVGGLVFSTGFTLLIVPVVYLFLVTLAERLGLGTVPPRIDLEIGGEEEDGDEAAVAAPAADGRPPAEAASLAAARRARR